MKKHRLPHEILQSALERKIRKNPSYSLRALARQLKVTPSYLSKVLLGKKPVPEGRLDQLAQALGIDAPARKLLAESLLQQAVKKKSVSSRLVSDILSDGSVGYKRSPVGDYVDLSEADFDILDSWYKLAILDLSTCKGFDANPGWVAERLGITVQQARDALKELQSRKFLCETAPGKWSKTDKNIRFPTVRSHRSVRGFH